MPAERRGLAVHNAFDKMGGRGISSVPMDRTPNLAWRPGLLSLCRRRINVESVYRGDWVAQP